MNAVLISVIVMLVLSLLRVNVIFSLIFASLTAGLVAGIPVSDATTLMVNGMGDKSGTALSYVLLGMFAVMIGLSGIMSLLVQFLRKVFPNRRFALILMLAFIASFSQNLIPVHIAFIPILIPPLLHVFNEMKIDRRAVASALTFGLKFPYITIPVGYGLLYQTLIKEAMDENGMPIAKSTVSVAMLFPGAAMIIGLFIAVFITYRKQVEPKEPIRKLEQPEAVEKWNIHHTLTILAIIGALAVQIWQDSLILGALIGIIILFIAQVVPAARGDEVVQEGIAMMGFIAFVMLIAGGYANVLKETGHVNELVEWTLTITGTSPFIIAFFLLSIGLIITLGIGSSFATIPILATLYIPVFLEAGISVMLAAVLIGTASALGDAGSPASDSTLGPTAGLNADGTHHHIWDTCVPTFLHYNIPLFLIGLVAAVILG